MRTGNIMIGSMKRISSKFNEGDKVKIDKEYGGGRGTVVDFVGNFVIVKTKEGNQSFHSSNLKAINGIGAVKGRPSKNLLKSDFLSSAEYQRAKKLKNFSSLNYKWDASAELYRKLK